jgi:penicillin amidase
MSFVVSAFRRTAAIGLLCLTACSRGEQPAPPVVAQVAGTMAVSGLSAPVRVVRDRAGVPHIYAESQDDLFFEQ